MAENMLSNQGVLSSDTSSQNKTEHRKAYLLSMVINNIMLCSYVEYIYKYNFDILTYKDWCEVIFSSLPLQHIPGVVLMGGLEHCKDPSYSLGQLTSRLGHEVFL